MDLSDAEAMARGLIAQHLDARWSFKWDNAKTRLGACHHRNQTITLSKHFTALNGEAETRDTVLHEIAHALTPGAAHGPAWQKTAARIGARPIARADGRTLVKPVATWVAQCPRCTATMFRYRRATTPVACARCCRRHNGGRFDRRFEMTWSRLHEIPVPPDRAVEPPARSVDAPPVPTRTVPTRTVPTRTVPSALGRPTIATQLDLFADLRQAREA